jgi:hypothetical protein
MAQRETVAAEHENHDVAGATFEAVRGEIVGFIGIVAVVAM